MKYPIDAVTTENLIGQLIIHERTQRQTIKALIGLLQDAMLDTDDDEAEWYTEAERFLKMQAALKIEHDNRLFNEKNGHAEKNQTKLTPETANPNYIGKTPAFSMTDMITDPEVNARLTQQEKQQFGEEMTEAEVAELFGEKPRKKKKGEVDMSSSTPFKDMTLAQIEEWEANENNRNDIYKVKARVANLARGSGGSLTAQGEQLCNSFVHVLMDLYSFAEQVADKETKIKLIERIRKNEGMPGILIAAAGAGVKK